MKTLLTRIQDTFPLPEETVVPFREAEICYRAGAYRAALLFSYIGWGLALRSRLLRATCPAGIPQELWEKHLTKLRSEEDWDHEVFDLTQRQKPAPVFLVSEDLRHQVRYWKDRRNDCAHFKANEIDHSHVESFWHFIFSNLGKFVPNGSADALLNKIVLYFDLDFTPPNTPLDPIIEQIPHCVERDELTDFFKNVAEKLSSISNNLREINRVFDAVIRLANDSSSNTLREFLVTDERYLIGLLREFPQHVILLEQHPELVRSLWRKHLFSENTYRDLSVFTAMLRAELIPQEEIAEANARAIENCNGDIPSPIDKQILDQYGFFAIFSKIAFEDSWLSNFTWANGKAKLVYWYLESYPIPVEAIQSICSIVTTSTCPWTARDELKKLFKENITKRQEFEKIAQQEQLALPKEIF